MPRCWDCGKRGLFLKLNLNGRCSDCERKALRRAEAERKRVAELQRKWEIEECQKLSRFRKYFPLNLNNDQTASFLSIWDIKTHNSENQVKRQRRALCETIPIEINTRLCSATFVSRYSNTMYKTDMVCCTCPDYSDRELPCKHMYRLFYELNHAPQNPGIIDISYPILDKFGLLSDEAKSMFIRFCTYRNLSCPRLMPYDNVMKELVQAGMISASAVLDYTPLLSKLTKDEIILALAKKGVSGYRPSWSKVKLIDWVTSTQADFLKKHFKNYALFQISPDLMGWAEGINTSWKRFHVDISADPFSVPEDGGVK